MNWCPDPVAGTLHGNLAAEQSKSFLVDIRHRVASRVALILGVHGNEPTPLVVAFELSEKRKAIVADALASVCPALPNRKGLLYPTSKRKAEDCIRLI